MKILLILMLFACAISAVIYHQTAVAPHKACLAATEEYNASGYWAGWMLLHMSPDPSRDYRMEEALAKAKARMHAACGTSP